MIYNIHSAKTEGIEAKDILVETEITTGIGIHIVGGLADVAVKESLLRTVTALQSLGYHIPGNKVIINLKPADLHKNGTEYDLAIALSLIAASGQAYLPNMDKWLVLGESALDGTLRAVPGCVPSVLMARSMDLAGCIIPLTNAKEVLPYAGDLPVYAVSSVVDAVRVIRGGAYDIPTVQEMTFPEEEATIKSSWDEIIGSEGAKRAMIIAAAGGHHVLLIGPERSQQDKLARGLVELLPPMTAIERTEHDSILSITGNGMFHSSDGKRPFRAPHVSTSMSAMFGGGCGDNIQPGEVSLASSGVLYLKEFAETPKSMLDALRGPLEDKKVIISRLKNRVTFPAKFQLVVATKPCPCGQYGNGENCTCTANQRMLYLSRLSGPIMDQIAIQAWTSPITEAQRINEQKKESDLDEARQMVATAREMQKKRYAGTDIQSNDDLNSRTLHEYIKLNDEGEELIERLMVHLGLSARAYSLILKIARTIADIDASEDILPQHIAEAASFRFLDRRNFFYNEEKQKKTA